MKFSHTLKSNQVNEWRDNYVAYDEIKYLINKNKKAFKSRLTKELNRINDFYFQLEKKAVDEKEEIFADVKYSLKDKRSQEEDFQEGLRFDFEKSDCLSDNTVVDPVKINVNEGIFKGDSSCIDGDESDNEEESESKSNDSEDFGKKIKNTLFNRGFFSRGRGLNFFKIPKQFEKRKREKNLHEFLHSLIKIKRFRELNYMGMSKLSKKYDKTYPGENFNKEFMKKLNDSYFNRSKRIDVVHKSVKELYKQVFAKDDPKKAHNVFRKLKHKEKTNPVFSFISGLFIGIIGMITLHLDFTSAEKEKWIFYSMSLIFYSLFLFVVCILIFQKFQINYKFIFNFDLYSTLNRSSFLLVTTILALLNTIWTYLNLNFFHTWPYFPVLVLVIILIFPFKIFFYNSRIYLMLTLLKIVAKPFSPVRFRHFYFADLGQSLTFCIKAIFFPKQKLLWWQDSILASLFSTIRFFQCIKRFHETGLLFPHIANAVKYSLTIITAVYLSRRNDSDESEFYTKIIVSMISCMFSMAWDLFMDWGIIRNRFMYPKYVYPPAIVFNVISRIYGTTSKFFKPNNPFIPPLIEITRRMLWTALRVEFEHLNNCSEFESKGSILLTSRELFYKKDYVAKAELSETETDHDSSVNY